MDEPTHARRYAKACDACYKKKIKCVFSEDGCDLCRKTGKTCVFTRMEKAIPRRPRRGKYLAALENRMKNMEEALQQSNQSNGEQTLTWKDPEPERPIPEEALATIICRGPTARPQVVSRPNEFRFPAKDHATALVLGYFASYNHMFPIWCKREFMQRMKEDYPPDKHAQPVWWSAVVTVLCFAHRLRAMSNVLQAEAENQDACRYLQEALDMAPKLAFAKASIGSAQVLLGIASILRGTPMPDQAPMLVAVAIRMLQDLNAHQQPKGGTARRDDKISERTFWFSYIIDKDISLQSRKPPVLHEEDIGLGAMAQLEEDGIGTVRSLDSSFGFNLFRVARDLACIQGHVWTRIHSVAATVDRGTLEAAQEELNPVLAKWRNDLPFRFKTDDLVGRWPKHAILHIVILHFRYFQTLVELNREPPMGNDDDGLNPLNGNCPIAKSLPSYPHSTSTIAVEAARDALDLAALTPRGNFQNVWMFFQFSISAVLTLLVNGIVRPLDDEAGPDLRRVDTWLHVIDILATSSERPDLIKKKEFLHYMRTWTLHVIQDALSGGNDSDIRKLPCIQAYKERFANNRDGVPYPVDDLGLNLDWMPELGDVQPDLFPLDLMHMSDAQYEWMNVGIDGSI